MNKTNTGLQTIPCHYLNPEMQDEIVQAIVVTPHPGFVVIYQQAYTEFSENMALFRKREGRGTFPSPQEV